MKRLIFTFLLSNILFQFSLFSQFANAGSDQIICSDFTMLNANALTSGLGQWSLIYGAAIFLDYTDPKTQVSNLASGDNILIWTIVDGDSTTNDTVVITNNMPTIADAGVDQEIFADSATLSANTPVIGVGSWSLLSGSALIEDVYNPNTLVSSLANGDNIFSWTIANENCISTDNVTITKLEVGIKNKLYSLVSLFPNPAVNTLNIKFQKKVQLKTITIYNLIGVIVKTVKVGRENSSYIVKISDLPSGKYFAVFIGEDFNYKTKFIKQSGD